MFDKLNYVHISNANRRLASGLIQMLRLVEQLTWLS